MEHEDNRPLEISFNTLIEKVKRELAKNGVKDASNYEIEWSLRRLMKETDKEKKENVRGFRLNTEEFAILS